MFSYFHMNFIRTIIVGEALLEKEIGIEDMTVIDTGRILCKFLDLGFLLFVQLLRNI